MSQKDPIKEITDVLNSIPKENLNYAMQIYDRYAVANGDGVFETSEDKQKVFILPYIVKLALTEEGIGDEISDSYFDALEAFFKINYQFDFILKTDLFLMVMAEKTRKNFSIKGGDEIVPVGHYKKLFGVNGDFNVTSPKKKVDVVRDIVNLYIAEYLKKVFFVRIFIIYDILIILNEYDYSPSLTDEMIFERVTNNLKESFMIQPTDEK